MRPKRRHTITLTFARPLSEHQAREAIRNAVMGMEMFRQLSKLMWDTARAPIIRSYSVKRRK